MSLASRSLGHSPSSTPRRRHSISSLADVQQYSQPVSYGVTSYELNQWLLTGYAQDSFHVNDDLTLDLGLRYDRQTLTDATKNFAPRVGFGWHPNGDSRTAIRGGYGVYYTQVRSNDRGLLTTASTAIRPTHAPGNSIHSCHTGRACRARSQDVAGFAVPALTSPSGPAKPVLSPAVRQLRSQLVARRTIPTSSSIRRAGGVDRGPEITKGLFVGDYVHQQWTNLDPAIDLNAPSAFDHAIGQTTPWRRTPRARSCRSPAFIRSTCSRTSASPTTTRCTELLSRPPGCLAQLRCRRRRTPPSPGNGIGPTRALTRLGEEERGPSVVDQRHRA